MQKDKMALPFGGSSLLASSISRFSACFDTVLLSVGDACKYPEIDAKHLVDIHKRCGPMSGLHAGLVRTDEDGVFLVAADLPYADPSTAIRIIELSEGFDVCVTADRQLRYEPLFAYYSKTVLPFLENALLAGGLQARLSLSTRSGLRVVNRGGVGRPLA